MQAGAEETHFEKLNILPAEVTAGLTLTRPSGHSLLHSDNPAEAKV